MPCRRCVAGEAGFNDLLGRSERRAMRPIPFRGLALGCGLVQGHGGANESLQRLLVYLLALVEVDGTPCVPVKTGVEEARRILQSRPFGEGHLHDVLVSLARADQSVVRPHRNPSPLPLLDDFGIGFLDQGTEPAEHLAPPVAKLLDSRVYQLRRRLAFLRPALLHARFSSLVPRDLTNGVTATVPILRGAALNQKRTDASYPPIVRNA